jgi:hypothetical protein
MEGKEWKVERKRILMKGPLCYLMEKNPKDATAINATEYSIIYRSGGNRGRRLKNLILVSWFFSPIKLAFSFLSGV